MSICDKVLGKDIQSVCNFRKGVARKAKIFNRDEVEGVGVFPENYKLQTIPHAQGYDVIVPGNNPFEGLAQNIEQGTYMPNGTVDIPIVIVNNDPETAGIVDTLMNGEFVMVVENNSVGGGMGKYQVFGWEVGLRGASAVHEPYGDNPGWTVTMHEEGSTKPALFLSEEGWRALASTNNIPEHGGSGGGTSSDEITDVIQPD